MKFDLTHAIEVLERTPAVLHSQLAGLSDAWITNNEGEDTFSPRDVVGHLLWAERQVWVPRIRTVLEQGVSEEFSPFDRFGFRRALGDATLDDLLEGFEQQRQESLEFVRTRPITNADFSRTGRHPEFGEVRLEPLLATWVAHDLGHLCQITRVMARQYREAVGPWAVYMRVMKE